VHLDFPYVLFSIIPPDLGELAFGLRLVRFVQRFFSCVGFLHSLFAAAASFFLLQSVSRSIFVLLER
jgi:hypothetical protein